MLIEPKIKLMKNCSGIQFIIFIGLLLTFSSCTNKNCGEDIDISSIEVNVTIDRLENEFFNLKTKDAVLEYLDKHKVLAEVFYQRSQYPHDSIVVNSLLRLAQNPSLDTVYKETQQVFGEMKDLKAEFEAAFKRVKYFYPNFEAPKIETTVTGFVNGSDLYMSDSLIIIGLDWYLGEQGTFRPNDVPQYILARMRKEYIVPSAIMFLSSKYAAVDGEDKTMLADMLFYGKAYAFTKTMMPCTADSLIAGYTQRDVDGINHNQERIWSYFIDKSLLYDTNHSTKKKYVDERPSIPEIGDDCPGRIGRWLGWKIIQKYRKESGVEFADLMKETDAKKIFMQSKYRPENH